MTLPQQSRSVWNLVCVLSVIPLLSGCLEGTLSIESLSHNVAETAVEHEDPDLRPRLYSTSPEAVFDAAIWVAHNRTRWALAGADPQATTLHAEHTTRLFRWVDDVHITITETQPGMVTVTARSASRVGKGDLGQTAFNIKDFFAGLDERLATTLP